MRVDDTYDDNATQVALQLIPVVSIILSKDLVL